MTASSIQQSCRIHRGKGGGGGYHVQTQELERFLQKQAISIRWEDGVYDRLLLGQRAAFDLEAPPLKAAVCGSSRGTAPSISRFIV